QRNVGVVATQQPLVERLLDRPDGCGRRARCGRSRSPDHPVDSAKDRAASVRLARMRVAQRTMPVWEQRFRAPVSFLPEWSPSAPDRCVYASNEAGVWQLCAWEPASAARRQVTESRVGVIDATPTLDGEDVLWFDDDPGDESGRWLMQPFAGGASEPLLENVPHGWSDGLAQAPGIVAAGISNRDGFGIYVSLDGEPAKQICRSDEAVSIGYDPRGFFRGGLS